MYIRARTMSALALLTGSLLPMQARANDPSPEVVAQLQPSTGGVNASAGTPANGGASEHINVRSSIGPAPGNSANPTGISTNPATNTLPGAGNTLQSIPTPISGPPQVGLFTGFGDQLLRDGIDVHGIYLNRYLLDSTAGPHPHVQGDISSFAPAADFDLEKLLGIRGGTIHTQFSFNFARVDEPNLADYTGGWLTGWQTTPALPGLWAYPSYITYEQKLLNQKLSIEFGRTNFFRYFFQPNALDPFFNISAVAQVVGDSSSVPFPTWGARAIYHFTPKYWVQVAAFADNDFQADDEPFTVGAARAVGSAIFAELGSRTEFFNSRYPENFELGVEYSTRTGYSFTKGSPLPEVAAFTAANYPGGGFVFLHGQQVLWRGPRKLNGPPANIALYGSVDPSYDKPQPFDLDAIVGVNFVGFVPGRPYDALGFQTHYLRLSKVEAGFESKFHDIFAGPGPNQPRNNFAFDATYNLSFNNIVSLRPSLQYFVDPDNYGDPTFNKRPGDGFEISAELIISLGRLLGTSNKPF